MRKRLNVIKTALVAAAGTLVATFESSCLIAESKRPHTVADITATGSRFLFYVTRNGGSVL
jgi:hypothetical protein